MRPWLLIAVLAMAGNASAASASASGACVDFRWITLGTAGGPAATPDRGEPSNLLIFGDHRILVDAGDGTAGQLAKIGVDLGSVEAVFISHLHLDHTGGLGAVIGLRWMNQYPGRLHIIGPPGTREMINGLVASMAPSAKIGIGVGPAMMPPAQSVEVTELRGGTDMDFGELHVSAVRNTHYGVESSPSADAMQSLSYRFAQGPRAIVYTGDTGPSSAVEGLARHADLLVAEVIEADALLSNLAKTRKEVSPAMLAALRTHFTTHHLTPDALGELAQAAGVSHLMVTHLAIAGSTAQSQDRVKLQILNRFHGPVDVAHDLQGITVPCP